MVYVKCILQVESFHCFNHLVGGRKIMDNIKKILASILCLSVLGSTPVVSAPGAISNKMHVAGTVAASVISAVASGGVTYLLIKEMERQGDYKEFCKDHPLLIKMAPFGAGLLGGGIGGTLTWFYLKQFAPAGDKERADEEFKKIIKNGLLDGDIGRLNDLILVALNNNAHNNEIDTFIINNTNSSRRSLPEARNTLKLIRKDINQVLTRIELAEENGGTDGLVELRRRVEVSKNFVDNLGRYISSVRSRDLNVQEDAQDKRDNPYFADIDSRNNKRRAETDLIHQVNPNRVRAHVNISSVDGYRRDYRRN